ncbi:ralA-binding protein 1-like [Argiope bruennichi]|uniref:RalA-binding protein 1 like protein n=1 Tax=Argiope bruennichi TaxID=94029 RepID=A0A8T0FIM3_ARGBR|nr:ralA-binding protein 1-like [Argiope bruennichi]XP_055929551.1 ralA-binding protein 1-like [Argiope bruennichi]KAF8790796.1 RalA-binding protein 1 like protein [Argiope bruennichi]
MDFESPDVAKDFPGLYASDSVKRSQSRDSDYSDEEKSSKKDLLGKKKDKKESKKDKGYVVFEGESSGDEFDEARSPGKGKKNKSSTFKFPGKDKKDKHNKSKDSKEKKDEKEKVCKKESKEGKKDFKEPEKIKIKKKKESKLLRIKDKKKKSIDQEVKEDKPIFGVPLAVAVERSKSHDGIELPVIVRECIDYIEEHGLACEGIYKISGLKSKVRKLKDQYNRREKVYLYEHEPHIVASLLKQFLRDLPEPILTAALASKFEEAAVLKNEQKKVETLQKLVNELPNCNRLLLSWIFIHMKHVMALERRNKMNLQNVSIVLSPTMQISHNVLQSFFTHIDILFKGVELKKYVPPIELDSTRLSLELPDSPSAIADELSRQENVLNTLHAELNTGLRDQQKEEKLWEIQRVVTQLKRKLRFLRQIQNTSNSRSEEAEMKCKGDEADEVENLNTVIQPFPTSTNSVSKDTAITHEKVESLRMECSSSVNESSEETKPIVEETVRKMEKLNIENIQQENDLSGGDMITEIKENVPDASLHVNENETLEEQSIQENDASIPKHSTSVKQDDEDENIYALIFEEKMMKIQYDELILLGDELKRKINSEKLEIDRLKMEVNEYQQLYKYKRYAFDSTENSSSDSDDSSASDYDDEEEDLAAVLEDLIKKNKLLEEKNKDISKVIQHEREVCLNIKVEMKMLQTEVKYMIA